MSLVGTLALRGDSSGALREADLAGPVLHGVSRRASSHSGLGSTSTSATREALEGYRRAMPVLRRADDRLGEAHAYGGRGVAHYLRGTVGAAEADMRRAEGCTWNRRDPLAATPFSMSPSPSP